MLNYYQEHVCTMFRNIISINKKLHIEIQSFLSKLYTRKLYTRNSNPELTPASLPEATRGNPILRRRQASPAPPSLLAAAMRLRRAKPGWGWRRQGLSSGGGSPASSGGAQPRRDLAACGCGIPTAGGSTTTWVGAWPPHGGGASGAVDDISRRVPGLSGSGGPAGLRPGGGVWPRLAAEPGTVVVPVSG
jgi:hypothetical protein